jgi:hypothetical protein
MTIPTLSASNTNNTTSVSPFTITIPAHVSGDLIVVFIERNGNAQTITPPDGWTSLAAGSAGPNGALTAVQRVFYKFADDTSPASISVSSSVATSQRQVSRCLVISGVDRNSGIVPIEFSTPNSGAASVAPTMPALTLTLGTRDALWAATLIDTGQQPSVVPSGFTTQGSFISTGLANNLSTKSERAASQAAGTWTTASTRYYSTLAAFIGPEPPNVNVPDDRIGPRGFLGIPVRRFKERSGEVAIQVIPYVPTSFTPAFFWTVT